MSAGGLLASMLGGAAQSGAAMANKISSENRANKRQDGLLQKKIDREDLLLKNENARQDQQTKDKNQFTLDRDSLNHQRNLTLASIKSKTSKTAKQNVNRYEQVFTTDEFGNKSSAGSFDRSTGKTAYYGDQSNAGPNEELLANAEKYADSVIDDKSGYFSGDGSDFKEFGGSRAQAKEFYRQQYIQQNSATPSASLSPVEQIMRANPSFDKAKAQAYLKHINQQ